MIENITARLLRIHDGGAIYGGGYDQNGNPTGGPGFYLGTDGRFKAVDGEFSGNGLFQGRINATDGYFNGVVNATAGSFKNISITGDSSFSGSIDSGPLYLSKNITSIVTYSYSNMSVARIYDDLRSRLSITDSDFSISTSSGSLTVYGRTYSNITRLAFFMGNVRSMWLYDNNEAKELLNYITNTLKFTIGSGGYTFKLIGLPNSLSGSNIVYRDQYGYLRIG
jgi:hypothetical protein